MYVYFIRAGSNGPIKIGVADNVESRMDTLQTGNHMELSIVAKIKCSGRKDAYRQEANLHKFFSYKRLRGEWFCGSIRLSNLDSLTESDQQAMEEKFLTSDSDRELLANCPF